MALPGGVQEHCRGLARALVDLGDEVTLFAPDLDDDGDLDGVVQITLGGTVRVRANRSVAPLGIDPRMLVRYDLGMDPADVVHVHEPFLPAGLGALFRAPKVTPVVGTFHAAAERSLPYAIASPVLRRVGRRLAATTAVSPAARRLAHRYLRVDPEIVPNGVDVAAFAAAEPDPWAAGLGKVVLFVGRPEPRKGFEIALRAFAGAAAAREDWHLVCVPARPEEGGPIPSGVASRVHRLGPLPRARLLALHRAAEIVVVPSLGRESFGLTVIEGLAGASAVLASDIPGYRYAGGDACDYLPVGDLQAWRRALVRLMDDPDERRRMSDAGPDRAAGFDWPRIAEQTLDVYRRGGA